MMMYWSNIARTAVWIFLGIIIGVMLIACSEGGCANTEHNSELRSVMETYHFGLGLAELTGDTRILRGVATDHLVQNIEGKCADNLCNGSRPPYSIGEYFRVVKLTEVFALVELEHRPILLAEKLETSSYIKICYLLLRASNQWKVQSAYIDCGYAPDEY